MVRGYLVLENATFPLTALPDSARRYLRTRTPYLLVSDTADILVDENDGTVLNACFVLEHTANAPTHAGGIPAGITKWRQDSTGTIRMTLYESPDAGYDAQVVIERERMEGTGRSWMAGEGDAVPRDFISGTRIAPPQRARCVSAMEAAAREHERVRAAIREAQQRRTPPPPRPVEPR